MSQQPIVNRVANSALINIDLAEHPPAYVTAELDLAQFLEHGLILREKDFRTQLENLDFAPFEQAYVRVFCSTEAILPAWAYQLVATKLSGWAKKVLACNLEAFNLLRWSDHITQLDLTQYQGGRVLLKGCSDDKIPQAAYSLLAQRLAPVVKKLMFGEACSFVPLY
jgi:hypothetical protein